MRVSNSVVHRVETGFRSRGIGQRHVDRVLLRLHVGIGLYGLDLGDHLALADVIALLHQNLGDGTHRIRAQVDVVLGFDLAGRGYRGGKVLTGCFAGLHGDHTALVQLYTGEDAAADHDDQGDDE